MMRRRLQRPAAVLFMLLVLAAWGGPAVAKTKSEDLQILGWVERVEIVDLGFEVKAKLDSGAETSSLDATDIQVVKRDDGRWVKFSVTNPETGEVLQLDKKRVRRVRIKRHNGEHQLRQVVKIEVCVGGVQSEIEVSLIDRSEFVYPLLLGRAALEDVAVIDPGETFIGEPHCGDGPTGRTLTQDKEKDDDNRESP